MSDTLFALLPAEIPELEPLGLHTEIATVKNPANGRRINALRIYGAGTAEHRALLEDLGFKFDRQSGSFLSDGPVDKQRLLLAFPIEMVPVPAVAAPAVTIERRVAPPAPPAVAPKTAPEEVRETLAAATTKGGIFSDAPRPVGPTAPVAETVSEFPAPAARETRPKANVIGVNALDAAVYQTVSGERFYRVQGEEPVYEEDEAIPGHFLRAKTIDDLEVVARGLISPALKGRALAPNDMHKCLQAVNEGQQDQFAEDDLVNAAYKVVGGILEAAKTPEQARALANRLHRFTGGSFASVHDGVLQPFPILNAMREIAPTKYVAFGSPDAATPAAIAGIVEQGRGDDGEGRTLVAIRGFEGATPTDEVVRQALGEIPASYVIEGSQYVVEPLLSETTLFLSIGARRPEKIDMGILPQAVWQVGYASEPEPLGAWLEGIATAQAAAQNWFEAIRRGEVAADTVEKIEQNRWQVPAQTMSKVGKPSLMVPVNLKGALEEAQQNFLTRHPEGADAFVANALRRPVSSLGQILLPEQVDTVAFDLDAEGRGRGFLVGNTTGTGKGRTAAARVQVSRLNGKRVLLLTERPVGLGTLVRDMINIGAFSPTQPTFQMELLNAVSELTEAATGSILFKDRSANAVREIFMPNGVPTWPVGVDVILGTYSGFNRDAENGWRTQWLEKVIDKNTHLVLDESHIAASAESNTAENLISAIAQAGHTMHLSATFVPEGGKAGVYFSTLAANADAGLATVLPKTISNAGEAGHEEFSNLLVRDGAMTRFERSFEEVDFGLKVSSNAAANREKLDLLAPVIRELLAYSNIVKKQVAVENIGQVAAVRNRFDQQRADFLRGLAAMAPQDRQRAERENKEEWERVRKNASFRAMSFGSPLYRIQKAFAATVAVTDPEGIINEAIEHLKSGRKPVIVCDQTMQSTITAVKLHAEEMGVSAPVPTFKHLLHQILRTMGRAANRNNERIDVGANAEVDAFQFARNMSSEIIDGLAGIIKEMDAAGQFTKALEEAGKKKNAEVLREYLDDAVDAVLEASFTGYEHHTGEPLSAPEKEKVRSVVGIVVEDAFTTTATSPTEIAGVMQELVKDFNKKFDVKAARESVVDMIEGLPDLPISFIDEVKHRIENAGFKIGEITGRTLSLDRRGNIVPRVPDKIESVRDKFNNGELHAAILNSAGASMIDLHSDRTFKDQRQRVLMTLQLPPATTLQQMVGRVDRYGQVIPPRVEFHINGMPTEARFIAHLNQHLARMNANLASIRKHPLICDVVPPVLTRDGDVATARVLLGEKALLEQLGIEWLTDAYLEKLAKVDAVSTDADDDVDALDDGVVKKHNRNTRMEAGGIKSFTRTDNRRLANEVLSRASILPSATQSELLREIEAQYYARIEERAALGLDTTGVKMIDGEVEVRATRILDPGDAALPDHMKSAFRAPLSMKLVNIHSRREPIRGKEVVNLVSRAIARGDDQKLAERIARFERDARKAAEQEMEGQDLGFVNEFVATRAAKRAELLSTLPIGGGLTAYHEGEKLMGVIVGFADNDFDPAFEVALPGQANPKRVYMSAISNILTMHQPWAGIAGGERRKTLKMFDDAVELNKVEQRIILTGNNWSAVQLEIGKIVSWTDAQGNLSRGVMVPKNVERLPAAITRLNSSADYVRMIENAGTHTVSVSYPIMPWSTGIDNHGINMEISFWGQTGRGPQGTQTFYGTVHFRGTSTTEGKLHRNASLSVADRHLETFLSAAGGLPRQLIPGKEIEAIEAMFRQVRETAKGGETAGDIQDNRERARVRKQARGAEHALKTGIPIYLKGTTFSDTNVDVVIGHLRQIIDQAVAHGLEGVRKDPIHFSRNSKQFRNWMLGVDTRPEDCDGFIELARTYVAKPKAELQAPEPQMADDDAPRPTRFNGPTL